MELVASSSEVDRRKSLPRKTDVKKGTEVRLDKGDKEIREDNERDEKGIRTG
jgi:hypothetical protein